MFSPRQSVALYIAAGLTVLFAVGVIFLELRPERFAGPKPLPHYKTLPPFELTNQLGGRTTLADLAGKVWLADFVYTTCPGPCPMVTRHMAGLQQKLASDPDVRFVSFSTDPTSDTPQVLKAYAAKYGATDRWTFLTGPQDKMYDLILHGFLLPIQAPKGAQIIHSTRVMLVDRHGDLRGFYDGETEADDAQIVADVERLRAE